MTLSWPRITWPAWDTRQAGPRWRKMSATSTAGRDNGRASAGHLAQEVERARHLADRADRDAGVKRRGVELLVSEQNLDDADIGLLLQKMGGKAVPQRMNADTLGDAGTPRCQANDPMHLAGTRAARGSRETTRADRQTVQPFLRATRHHSCNISRRMGERMTYRSFLPLPCSTRMSIRSRSISMSLSDTTSEARRPVA